MVSKDKINEIKEAINIVDVISETVALSKAGRNYLGLCPFHGEKTPSFNVVEEKQFYHCFGCGRSGDVFKFIEELQGVPFMESVQILAERAGIQLDEQAFVPKEQKVNPHQALYAMHSDATKFYHAFLMTTKTGEEARDYLHKRGLTDDILRHFQIGLAPREPDILYKKLSEDYDEIDLLQSGLFHPSENQQIYDAFQNRIMFPLSDESGRVVAFSGRIWQADNSEIKQGAKYKNSRSTAIFNKSFELYHLDKAKSSIKKKREVYIMEGFMDVIAAYRSGIENVVASMGTSLTREHVQHLQKYCQKVVLAYDGDKAGQSAIAKALEELGDFEISIVSLPDNLDPDEFANRYSEDSLHQVLTSSRISDVEFLMQYLKPANPDNLQMQIEFVEQMAPIIAKTKSITAQNSYIYKLADLLPDFDYQQVENAVNNVRLTYRTKRSRLPASARDQEQILPVQKKLTSLVRCENHLLARMAEHPYILNDYRLREDFYFYTPELQVLFSLLKENGEISAYELSNQEEEVQKAWYQLLEERLPSELGSHELEELEMMRYREYIKRENRLKSRVIREQAHIGNNKLALDELAELIAQKRKME